MRFLFALLLSASLVEAQEKIRFRTDADGPVKADDKRKNPSQKATQEKPQWFQLLPGEFPPAGSEHRVSGELISVDHLERNFRIRIDRADHQERGVFDRPLYAEMLPFGSVWYHGAPAALQDIPLGTHLHGSFYQRDPKSKPPVHPGAFNKGQSVEADFQRCFRLEDDFTLNARQNRLWKIEKFDLEALKLTVSQSPQAGSNEPADPAKRSSSAQTPLEKTFEIQRSTRIFKGRRFVEPSELQPGQTVVFNITWATLYGAGRITEIWIDEESRQLATQQQLERHRAYIRERGLPGWITSVDDARQHVEVTFFGGVEPALFEEITVKDPNAPPPRDGTPPPVEPIGRLAVALDSLMTFDPVNDSKRAAVLEMKRVPVLHGSAGFEVQLRVDMMLEGYRPKRLVRFYPPTWKVTALPKEEEFQGRE
jgi:hypothetical protein